MDIDDTLQGKITFNSMYQDFKRNLASLTDPLKSAANKFNAQLPEFYESLADRIESAKGMTMVDFFVKDAERYSKDEDGKEIKTPRGILSAHWAERFMDVGGDLALTFEGTIPPEDVSLIRLGQEAGAGALPSTLRDLARLSLLIRKAKSVFFSSIVMGFNAIALVFTALIATPLFTVPKLRETFVMPEEFIKGVALNLFSFSDFLTNWLLVIVVFAAAILYLVAWSLSNYTGEYRKKLDKYLLWRMYRDMQGALFLAVLSTMVKNRSGAGDNLLVALEKMRVGSTPWRRSHINRMIDNIQDLSVGGLDNSAAIANAINTGIIDRESFFYFMDVQEGQGISVGLAKAGERVEGPMLKMVEKQASIASKLMLFCALGFMLSWSGTHMAAVKSLTDSMRTFMTG